jgi:hypothetical protein
MRHTLLTKRMHFSSSNSCPHGARSANMSPVARASSCLENHSRRAAARRRPRSSIGNFQYVKQVLDLAPRYRMRRIRIRARHDMAEFIHYRKTAWK